MNKNILILSLSGFIMILGAFLIINTVNQRKELHKVVNEPISYECDGDGKVCWDGSIVGRTGEDCHFVACPLETATTTIITTTLGQPMTGLNVTLTPKEIVSDSRCPKDVQCIWAGTVEVKTVMATKVSHGENVVKLNEPTVFGDFYVTLVGVTPDKKSVENIPGSSYRFVFKVKKR